jgi:iodotyrosine deiodinase
MPPIYVPFSSYHEIPPQEMKERAEAFRQEMLERRSVRYFSDRAIPREIIEECLLAAGSAPSGANLQPWHFVVISDPRVKKEIRLAAEKEEHEFYHRRATTQWLQDLAPLGTDEQKPFLEIAPYLIAIFSQTYRILPGGKKVKNYYVAESVGIATGMLITAIHHAGLVTLTHTPSPMGFLSKILNRPASERPYLLLVVGYPAEDAVIPQITHKALDEIATFV